MNAPSLSYMYVRKKASMCQPVLVLPHSTHNWKVQRTIRPTLKGASLKWFFLPRGFHLVTYVQVWQRTVWLQQSKFASPSTGYLGIGSYFCKLSWPNLLFTERLCFRHIGRPLILHTSFSALTVPFLGGRFCCQYHCIVHMLLVCALNCIGTADVASLPGPAQLSDVPTHVVDR